MSAHKLATGMQPSVPARLITQPTCWCQRCDLAVNLWRSRMSLCPSCGDKRCPRSLDHDKACVGPEREPQP